MLHLSGPYSIHNHYSNSCLQQLEAIYAGLLHWRLKRGRNCKKRQFLYAHIPSSNYNLQIFSGPTPRTWKLLPDDTAKKVMELPHWYLLLSVKQRENRSYVQEVHMKNVKWKLYAVLERKEGGGVWELIGDWGSFSSTPFFKCTV